MRYEIQDTRFKNEHNLKKASGFTLVEMIVAIAIFMIVAVVAVGSLVRIVALNRQAQTLQASVNNVGFALDSMSREIRQGSKIVCQQTYSGNAILPSSLSGDCENSQFAANQLIVFQTPKADSTGCRLYYAYWFKSLGNSQYLLDKAQQTSCTQTFSDTGLGGDIIFSPVIDTNNVAITGYNLAVFSGPSFLYKWVFVRISGISGVRTQDTNAFDVQTSVSQRIND